MDPLGCWVPGRRLKPLLPIQASRLKASRLRNVIEITIIQNPCYLVYIQTMVTYFKFLNSNPIMVGDIFEGWRVADLRALALRAPRAPTAPTARHTSAALPAFSLEGSPWFWGLGRVEVSSVEPEGSM